MTKLVREISATYTARDIRKISDQNIEIVRNSESGDYSVIIDGENVGDYNSSLSVDLRSIFFDAIKDEFEYLAIQDAANHLHKEVDAIHYLTYKNGNISIEFKVWVQFNS